MKRTNKMYRDKTPSAILTADIHIRETHPQCRKDEFVLETQWRKLNYIKQLQEKYQCPVLNAGDMFDKWKNSPWLLTKTMQNLPDDFWTVYGDHDQPHKNIEFREKSSIETLREAHKLHVMPEGHWGNEKPSSNITLGGRNILVWHKFVWDGKNWPWPDCPEETAEQVMERFPGVDLFVTGDYHKGFIYTRDNQLLVNCGCLSRQDASYADYRPRMYLWYAEENTVEEIYIPIDKEAVSREHIEQEERHKERLQSFIESIPFKDASEDKSVSFEERMKRWLSKNRINKRITEIIEKAIYDEKERS